MTHRGATAVHLIFNKMLSILEGDYILARASIFLARLRDMEVLEIISGVIDNLVRKGLCR